MSIIERIKFWLWNCGVPGKWLFPEYRPRHWWDDVFLHHCDNMDCNAMIYQGDLPEAKPDAEGLYFCQQCGGPFPRLFEGQS